LSAAPLDDCHHGMQPSHCEKTGRASFSASTGGQSWLNVCKWRRPVVGRCDIPERENAAGNYGNQSLFRMPIVRSRISCGSNQGCKRRSRRTCLRALLRRSRIRLTRFPDPELDQSKTTAIFFCLRSTGKQPHEPAARKQTAGTVGLARRPARLAIASRSRDDAALVS
jgi:hypothetical protein